MIVKSKKTENNENIFIEQVDKKTCLRKSKDSKTKVAVDDKLKTLKHIENPQTIKLLHAIYNAIKDKSTDASLMLENKDISDKDYMYIVSNLFTWFSKNKFFIDLINFYIKTATNYSLDYFLLKEFLNKVVIKYKYMLNYQDLIKETLQTTAIALSIGIVEFIEDFTDYEVIISYGFYKNNLDSKLIREMVFSSSHSLQFIGSRCYNKLHSPDFDLLHLIETDSDIILREILKTKIGANNDVLLNILFKRGVLDEINANIIKLLDIKLLQSVDLSRVYSLFHLDPLNYVAFGLHGLGFALNESIVIDLIKCLESVYCASLFKEITDILKSFSNTDEIYKQMIISLNDNYLFKCWVLRNLNTENISLPFFIKFCWFIANEDDLELVRLGIIVLKKGKVYDIIESWSKIKKFEKLVRRIYPLIRFDPVRYRRIYDGCADIEEKAMLDEIYGL